MKPSDLSGVEWTKMLAFTAAVLAACFITYLWVEYLLYAFRVGVVSPAEWWIQLDSESAAAWVGALGSIAAIVVAFLVPHLEHQRRSKAERIVRLLKIRDNIEEIYDDIASIAVFHDHANAMLSTGDSLSNVMEMLIKQAEQSARGINLLRTTLELFDTEEVRALAISSLSALDKNVDRCKGSLGAAQRYEQQPSKGMESYYDMERKRLLKVTESLHVQLCNLADSLNMLRLNPGPSLLEE